MIIRAMSDKGKKAIQQHILERKKQSRFNPQRIMYDKFFKEEVISEKPYALEVTIKNPALSSAMRFEDFKQRIEEALYKNGALQEDFIIEEGV